MKALKSVIFLIGMLAVFIPAHAEEPNDSLNITVQAMVIALPKDRALQFTLAHDLKAAPEEALKDIEQLVLRKEAESVANPGITSISGQHAISEAGTSTLEMESSVTSFNMINTNIVFGYEGRKLTTSFQANNGEVKYLGAFDSNKKEKKLTYLVFVLVRASKLKALLPDQWEVSVSLNKDAQKQSAKTHSVPILLTIKNNSNASWLLIIDRWNNNGVTVYSLDEPGTKIVISQSTGFGEREDREVKPGETTSVTAEIPLKLLNKHKHFAVSIWTGKQGMWPSDEHFSKPFTLSDLK